MSKGSHDWFYLALNYLTVPHWIRIKYNKWEQNYSAGWFTCIIQNNLSILTQEDELIQSENSASIFNTLSDIPSQIEDPDVLLQEAVRVSGSLTDIVVETQRCKHLAYLIADQGQLLSPGAAVNLSKVSF